MTEIPKLGHILGELNFRLFLRKSIPPGIQEKAWGQICLLPWLMKGPKSVGFYMVKNNLQNTEKLYSEFGESQFCKISLKNVKCFRNKEKVDIEFGDRQYLANSNSNCVKVK